MARCKKSYEDQLKAVEEQIAKVQEKLNHLKEQRENILSKSERKSWQNYTRCFRKMNLR